MDSTAPANLPPGVPEDAVPFLREVGYLEADTLSVGGPAPDLPLYTLAGAEMRLSQFRGKSPVVLVFGSHT